MYLFKFLAPRVLPCFPPQRASAKASLRKVVEKLPRAKVLKPLLLLHPGLPIGLAMIREAFPSAGTSFFTEIARMDSNALETITVPTRLPQVTFVMASTLLISAPFGDSEGCMLSTRPCKMPVAHALHLSLLEMPVALKSLLTTH